MATFEVTTADGTFRVKADNEVEAAETVDPGYIVDPSSVKSIRQVGRGRPRKGVMILSAITPEHAAGFERTE